MRVSVAMATFNGATYLGEQLESLRKQTLLPDELVVCDDLSTDHTTAIIERFAAEAPFPVRLHRNATRLGFPGNFEQAIQLCEGELIFCCDQDDYWQPSKVARVLQAFRDNPEAWLVVHDAALVNQDLEDSGLTLTGQLRTAGLDLDEFVWGCCMAVRRTLLPIVHPLPLPLFSHDTWINALALALDRRVFVHETLISFRRHDSNTTQYPTVSTQPASTYRMLREKLRWQSLRQSPLVASHHRLAINRAVRTRLSEHRKPLADTLEQANTLEAALGKLDDQYAVFHARAELQGHAFFPRIAASTRFYFAGQYTHFEGWKSWLRDILG